MDEEEGDSPFSTMPRRYLSSGQSQKARKSEPKFSTPVGDKSVPIFSSPEPELLHSSGRESSLSHTSNSSESFSQNLETPDPSLVPTKPGSYLGRASRQDLHNHLWREEKYKHKSPGIQPGSLNIPNLSDSSSLFASLPSELSKHTDITLQMSKPLPTEPIRRVDLGFSHKPLDKSLRFHRGQECYIKKVPQAIVAPFRRTPPELVTTTAVTPIHRASIAGISVASTLSTAVTTVTQAAASTSTPPTLQSPAAEPCKHAALEERKEALDKKESSPSEGPGGIESSRSPVPLIPQETVLSEPLIAGKVTPPKTRSQGVKQNDDPDTAEAFPERISLSKENVAVERMSKCQVEVCRLKEDSQGKEPLCKKLELRKSETAVRKSESRPRKSANSKKTEPEPMEAEEESVSGKPEARARDQTEPLSAKREKEKLSAKNVNGVLRSKRVDKEKSGKKVEVERQSRRIEAEKQKVEEGSILRREERKRYPDKEQTVDSAVRDQPLQVQMEEGKKQEVKSTGSLEQEKVIYSNEICPLESKSSFKKRKRRPNKTGFPTKNKKKKPRLDIIVDTSSEKSLEDSKLSSTIMKPTANELSMDKNENLEQIDSNNFRSREKQRSVSNLGEKTETSICKELENKLETNLKRNLDISSRNPGRSLKRLKLEGSSGDLTPSSSSSIDPSPSSSDVESLDSRLVWEDESDQDTLSVLPPSDESFTSPSPTRQKKKKKGSLRKTYLKAGLFSFDYKSVLHQNSELEFGPKLKGMIYKPEEHPFSLLPPPYYCGRQLRQKKEDFTLPFDIWSLYSSNTIPTRDVLATWNYKKIKNNIYYDVKPSGNYETPGCHCKFPKDPNVKGCTDDCINRMTYTECGLSCNLGDKCSNVSIQKHLSPAVVERFMTKEKGWGIRTKTAIPAGTFIMEYLGEVVTDKEFKRRMHTDYQKDSHHYCLHLGEGLVIDGHRMGGECRFVNHSCKPNCEMQKWSVNGVYRMALFSSKSLNCDEELTYDYNFSLFNPHEGQTCRCNTSECRGVIGGKSQRVRPLVNQPTQKVANKTEDRKKEKESQKAGKGTTKIEKVEKIDKVDKIQKVDKIEKENKGEGQIKEMRKPSLPVLIPVKQMNPIQREFCRTHSVLLPRNLEKIRKLRERYLNQVNHSLPSSQYRESNMQVEEGVKLGSVPSSRAEQTTRIYNASETADVTKVIQLAKCFREILSTLQSVKDKDGECIIKLFINSSSLDQKPGYYVRMKEAVDMTTVEKTLNSGQYMSVAQFDQDLLLVFQNFLRFYGGKSKIGLAALALRTSYLNQCGKYYKSLSETLGPEGTTYSRRPDPPPPEDEIGCPCNQFKDEGVMIQCENCGVWQHLDCVRPGVDPDTLGKFNCDPCAGVKPNLDIPLVPQPEYACPGELHFVSLKREDGLHVTLGMTVYVLRAFKDKTTGLSPEESNCRNDEKIFTGPGGVPHKSISPIKGPSKEAASLASGNYPTYRTVDQNVSTQDMDIFRVERLWKNEAGAMFAFGYHYLRPHETFHEPTRRFFDNEVFRVPLYEVLPLDTIWRECWLMDPASFCRGRPLAAEEDHVYICEYRVDKSARLFNKISKPKHAVCTKYYAFHLFDLRLRISRTYTVSETWQL